MAKHRKGNNNNYQKPTTSLGVKVAIWIMAGLMVAGTVATMIYYIVNSAH